MRWFHDMPWWVSHASTAGLALMGAFAATVLPAPWQFIGFALGALIFAGAIARACIHFFGKRKGQSLIHEMGGRPAIKHMLDTIKVLEERGTWTPMFSFTEPGDLTVQFEDADAEYWCLEGKWEAAGYLTCRIDYSTAGGNALIQGLPFGDHERFSGRKLLVICSRNNRPFPKKSFTGRVSSMGIVLDADTSDFPSGAIYSFEFSTTGTDWAQATDAILSPLSPPDIG